MKRILTLALLLLSLTLIFTACSLPGSGTPACQHRDADDNGKCDKCATEFTDGKDVTGPCTHRDADDNGKCDKCNTDFTDIKDTDYSKGLEFVSNGDGTCYVAGIGTCTDANIKIPSTSSDGDTVTSIGEEAFDCCDRLTSITIGKNVTHIGQRAFSSRTSLVNVYYAGTASDWNAITIDSSNENLEDATRYYYSEEAPTEAGNYWHYGADGNIEVWAE